MRRSSEYERLQEAARVRWHRTNHHGIRELLQMSRPEKNEKYTNLHGFKRQIQRIKLKKGVMVKTYSLRSLCEMISIPCIGHFYPCKFLPLNTPNQKLHDLLSFRKWNALQFQIKS